MKKMIILFAGLMLMFAAAAMLAGCSVTKVEYNQNAKGETSYRIYRNSHWLKMDAEGLKGGMTEKGRFEIALDGMKASPSEEFNRTMQTYTSAFIQLAQIAAAAYNPSASAAMGQLKSAEAENPSTLQPINRIGALGTTRPTSEASATTSTNAVECADGSCLNQ